MTIIICQNRKWFTIINKQNILFNALSYLRPFAGNHQSYTTIFDLRKGERYLCSTDCQNM